MPAAAKRVRAPCGTGSNSAVHALHVVGAARTKARVIIVTKEVDAKQQAPRNVTLVVSLPPLSSSPGQPTAAAAATATRLLAAAGGGLGSLRGLRWANQVYHGTAQAQLMADPSALASRGGCSTGYL